MTRLIRLFLLGLIIGLAPKYSQAQFMRIYTQGFTSEAYVDAQATIDGGFIALGDGTDFTPGQLPAFKKMFLHKTDAVGAIQWTRQFDQGPLDSLDYRAHRVIQTSDGGYLVMGTQIRDMWNSPDTMKTILIKTNAAGNTLWYKTYLLDFSINIARNIVNTPDGGFIFCGEKTNGAEYFTYKVDAQGDSLWTRSWPGIYQEGMNAIVNTPDGGFTIGGSIDVDTLNLQNNELRMYLRHFDSLGNQLWYSQYGVHAQNFLVFDMSLSASGKYAFAIIDNDTLGGPQQGAIAVFDNQGNFEFLKHYSTSARESPKAIWGTPDGGFVMTGRSLFDGGTIHAIKTDSLGNTEWANTYKAQNTGSNSLSQKGVSIAPTLTGGYVICTEAGYSSPYLIVVGANGEVETNIVEGNVFLDTNFDCILDSAEANYSAMVLELSDLSTNTLYHTVPDSNGYYQFEVQSGNYTLSTQTNVPYFNWLCPPNPLMLSGFDTIAVDIPLEITSSCPYNTVSVNSPAFPFNTLSRIYVQACNTGTLYSENTLVEVELDSALSFSSASPSPLSINGQILTFDLDTLDVLECVQIEIYAQLDTLTTLGATHCVEAKIYPDTVCGFSPWTGASITAQASCQNDSVIFELGNQGSDMLLSQNYTVYVDDVIFSTAPFQLNNGESAQIKQAALAGSTYRIEAMQEDNYPSYLGDSIAIAFFEGCSALPNGGFNVGFITQFYLGNSNPSEAIFCQENVFAYDPNDKLAQPKGYGPGHLIYNNTPLDYTIRFQNTGTDTARRVIILDTLSPLLDINSIELGAASHPYTFDIIRDNVLRFTFNPIVLPDSGANQAASNGNISFKVQLADNLPDGTLIENRAAIYFDYNPPIITPIVFHSIGSDFVPINLTYSVEPIRPELSVKVWPNPFREAVNIKIENRPYSQLSIEIMDINGRLVKIETVQNSQEIVVQAPHWPAGIYFFRLLGEGEELARGKMVLKN
ncbi:MAG: T9SS type A sorting domain-containing protein [Bacteroidota bacterium]